MIEYTVRLSGSINIYIKYKQINEFERFLDFSF